MHPKVKLDFVSWDGYNEDPSKNLDIFVYDAVFFYDFLEKGYLLPIAEEDITEIDDYFPYTLDVGKEDGIIYALPQLLCTNLLYARAEDRELANVRNIHELYQIIGDRSQTTDPLTDEGRLLMDMPDQISSALWYVEVQTDQEQSFSEWVNMPKSRDFDPNIMETLQMVQAMAGGYENGDAGESSGKRFADGHGRAFIGYSESMNDMGEAAGSVVFHRFSLSTDDDIPLMYADIASINAGISEKKSLSL